MPNRSFLKIERFGLKNIKEKKAKEGKEKRNNFGLVIQKCYSYPFQIRQAFFACLLEINSTLALKSVNSSNIFFPQKLYIKLLKVNHHVAKQTFLMFLLI